MKIAMIGASGHGSQLCIPKEYQENRDFVAVAPGSQGESVDSLVNRLQSIQYQPKVYASYRDLLKTEKPDMVVVDNFYGEHAPVIRDAFAAGCHVFAEKPVAASPEELAELEQAWKSAGTSFAAMLNYRYNGAFYRAFRLIQEGAIGSVRLLNAQKSYKFGKRPEFMTHRSTYGGTIPWVGIHAIDWILWMSGGRFRSVMATQCAAEAENGVCPETTALAQFCMDNGQMASLTVDYLNPAQAPTHGDDRIRVVGTAGVLEVRGNCVYLINATGVTQPENLPNEDIFADFLRQAEGGAPCRISAEEVFASTYGALYAQQSADNARPITIVR